MDELNNAFEKLKDEKTEMKKEVNKKENTQEQTIQVDPIQAEGVQVDPIQVEVLPVEESPSEVTAVEKPTKRTSRTPKTKIATNETSDMQETSTTNITESLTEELGATENCLDEPKVKKKKEHTRKLRLCKLVKKDYLKKHLTEYKELVENPIYICRKCGRVANNISFLCKPVAFEEMLLTNLPLPDNSEILSKR